MIDYCAVCNKELVEQMKAIPDKDGKQIYTCVDCKIINEDE